MILRKRKRTSHLEGPANATAVELVAEKVIIGVEEEGEEESEEIEVPADSENDFDEEDEDEDEDVVDMDEDEKGKSAEERCSDETDEIESSDEVVGRVEKPVRGLC